MFSAAECTEPAQTIGFGGMSEFGIRPISSNNMEHTPSTNTHTRSLEMRCTF